jgi:hypothetical protein
MYKSLAINPINVVDRNTANRIINAAIIKNYIEYDGHKDWVYAAIEELKKFNINITIPRLRQFLVGLMRNTRDDRSASNFNGKIFTRAEKEGMYRELDTIASLFVGPFHYVGLPANQLLSVCRKYNTVVACERDENMFNFMKKMSGFFGLTVELFFGDIIDHLLTTQRKYNLFDIDLMTYANKNNLPERLAQAIVNSSDDVAVVCLVTCGGRKISTKEYNSIMPYELFNEIRMRGLDIVHSKSGQYVDQIIPMRYEIFVVAK